MENQEVILSIMKRFFEENTYMDGKEFFIITGIETRPEKRNPVAVPDTENTDD